MTNWIKRYLGDLIGSQADGFRFARAVPLVFAFVVAIELAQHVLEVRLGFFGTHEQRVEAATHWSRVGLGWFKMATVYGAGFFALRWLVCRDSKRTLAVTGAALRAYAPVFFYAMAVFALIFHAPQIVAAAGGSEDGGDTVRTIVGLAQLALEPFLFAWFVSAATAEQPIGPMASARRTGRLYAYAFPLFFVARLPLNLLHQMLNQWSAERPPAVMWSLLIGDALLVGVLVAVGPAIAWRVSRVVDERAADAKGVSLLPSAVEGEGEPRDRSGSLGSIDPAWG